MKTLELTAEAQNQLARELYNKVDAWVNTFNWLQLEVLEKYTDNMLFESIRQQPLATEEYLHRLTSGELEELHTEFNYEMGNYADEEEEQPMTGLLDSDQEQFIAWMEENKADEIRDWQQDNERENYPMWNTLFEFKHGASEEILEKAQAVGLGVIEHEDFNPILFMMSAGHSFYSSYWIPLYLAIYEDEAQKYAGVNYSHL
jgi:hypothetical protein